MFVFRELQTRVGVLRTKEGDITTMMVRERVTEDLAPSPQIVFQSLECEKIWALKINSIQYQTGGFWRKKRGHQEDVLRMMI